jgi:DNA-directed RNA polymerase omega subunit
MSEGYVPVEKLLSVSEGSIYKLVILIAKRALQIADGDKPMIEKPVEKALDNAIREAKENKIRVLGKKK